MLLFTQKSLLKGKVYIECRIQDMHLWVPLNPLLIAVRNSFIKSCWYLINTSTVLHWKASCALWMCVLLNILRYFTSVYISFKYLGYRLSFKDRKVSYAKTKCNVSSFGSWISTAKHIAYLIFLPSLTVKIFVKTDSLKYSTMKCVLLHFMYYSAVHKDNLKEMV